MKSVLIDAIRRTNTDEPGQTLSDSGSFDTVDSEFGVTANDAVADTKSAAEDLQLYETSSALVLDEDGSDEAIFDSDTAIPESEIAEIASVIQRTAPTGPVQPRSLQRAPLIARYSPHLCLGLAILGAAAWFLLQRLEGALTNGNLGDVRQTTTMQEQPETVATGQARFRFLEHPLVATRESAE